MKPLDEETLRTADLIPLERVSEMLPSHPDRSTVFRWIGRGCWGARLRTVSVGRTRHTTERWLLAFFDEVAVAREHRDAPITPEAPTAPAECLPPGMRAHTARVLQHYGLSEVG